MTGFVRGLDLARAFHAEVIAPILGRTPHTAALLGWGSEVLGYDTERSTDHGWGPRLQIFVDADDVRSARDAIEAVLPETFHGWPTRFGWDDVQISHHVEVMPLSEWFRVHIGFDPYHGVALFDWLSTPQQALLEVTKGAVFRDDTGELTSIRESLAWYPDEVWLWLIACQWQRIGQEEPFVGRTAEIGDDLGSRVITARLVRDLMRLAFLLERRYAPYSKWLGTAFAELESGTAVGGGLAQAMDAADFAAREAGLVMAVEELARGHNALGLTATMEPTVRFFYTRPYRVVGAHRFVEACLERISDPSLRSLPLVGAIDQFVDSTDVLSGAGRYAVVRALYERWSAEASRQRV
jgi:hypothetical protein